MLVERGIVLFFHLLGVIKLFVAMGLIQQGGARVRSSRTVEEMRLWLTLLRSASRLFPVGSLLLLVTGLYLTARMWSFGTPWVVIALVSVVVMGILGGGAAGRGLARIGAAAFGAPPGPVSADLAQVARAPGLWIAATAANGMALGVVWIMVRKSGWIESIVAVTVLGALGAVAGARMTRRRAAAPQVIGKKIGAVTE